MNIGAGRREQQTIADQMGEVASAWRDIMESEGGRALVHDLINRCGVMAPIFTDAHTMAYQEGRRSVGIEIHSWFIMPLGAELYGLMYKEAEQRTLERAHARSIDEKDKNDAE